MPKQLRTTYNFGEVNELFEEVLNHVADKEQLLREVGEALLFNIDKRFETETDPDGKKWRPLSPFTIAMKQQQGRIQKILQSTGRLRGSFEYRISNEKLIIGTNVSYARKHQFGEGVPQRKIVGVSKEDRLAVQQITEDYLDFGS